MPATFSGAFQSLKNLLETSTLAKIIFIVVIFLILLVILIPLFQKFRRKQIKEKAARDITRDLMVWRHVAQMVKGGSDQNKAKTLLSDNIVRIKGLLDQGFELLSSQRRKLYEAPWFLLIGEPRSGKSSLLQESSLELVPSAEETGSADDGSESFPVRMWLGANSVTYDVSGRVFFDRWLEGSSAEWNYIVQQIRRRRSRKPLDGIILTIPGDALLADNEALSQKKAILMANELALVFHSLGMYLPCQVVVTKLDMVDGFREYVQEMSEDMRHQIFGYAAEGRLYDPAKFSVFWENLLRRLREGCKKSMLSNAVIARLSAAAKAPEDAAASAIPNRMDISGKMYLFPENFAALYRNLDIYLSTLFGKDNFQGSRNMVMEGLYFTSARDKGISLSPGLASLAGKSPDEFPLSCPSGPKSRPYFIRDLFHRVIFRPSPNTALTLPELARKCIPLYAVGALFLSIGGFWLYAVSTGASNLRLTLEPLTDYYSLLDQILQGNNLLDLPLITGTPQRGYLINTQPLPGTASKTISWASARDRFYREAYLCRDRDLRAPLGFKTASFFYFGFMRDMGYGKRAYIVNQLFGAMIRDPVIKAVGQKLIYEEDQAPPLTESLRSTIRSFLLLNDYHGNNYFSLYSSKDFDLPACLRYLMPNIADETVTYLNSYLPQYGKDRCFIIDEDYINTDDRLIANYVGLNMILNAWDQLNAYPNSFYGRLRELVKSAETVVDNYQQITAIAGGIENAPSIEDLQDKVTKWKSLLSLQQTLINKGRALFIELQGTSIIASVLRPLQAVGSVDVFSDNLIGNYLMKDMVLNFAVTTYAGLFKEDMDYVLEKLSQSYLNDMIRVLQGRVGSLQGNFNRNLGADTDHLRTIADNLNRTPLMSMKIADDPPTSDSLFNVTEKILNYAGALPLIDGTKLKKEDFSANLQKCLADISRVSGAFETFVKSYESNDRVKDLIAGERDMLLAESTLNRYGVMESGMDMILHFTRSQIGEFVRSSSTGENVFSLSNSTLSSILGSLVYDQSYDPQVVTNIAEELASFAELFTKYTNPQLQQSSRYYAEMEAFKEYLGDYIDYWGTYPDTAYPPLSTWDDYRQRLQVYQATQVNTMLQILYSKTADILNGIENVMLTDDLLKKRDAYAASLKDKGALITPLFNANCTTMLSTWSRLPGDADDAFEALQGQTPQGLKDAYMTAYSDKPELALGWWNDFTMNGFHILADTYYQKQLAQFNQDQSLLQSYPLCADAPISGALSAKELESIAWLLAQMGVTLKDADIAQIQGQNPVAALFHQNLFQGDRAKTWAGVLYAIASGLADTRKPLVWTVYQPPVSVQAKLPGSGRLPVTNRFRYVEVSSGSFVRSFLTYAKEEAALVQGNIQGQGITLRFFVMSNDRSPGCVLRFTDPWAILGLYLRQDGVTGDDGNRYIPLEVKDQSGNYVYYIRIGFNNEMPAPGDWYRLANWPVITITSDGVQAGRPVALPGGS